MFCVRKLSGVQYTAWDFRCNTLHTATLEHLYANPKLKLLQLIDECLVIMHKK